jgi:cold shock CspA family protein
MQGIIKKVFPDKGFGFITGEDGQDLFFHISKLWIDGDINWAELTDDEKQAIKDQKTDIFNGLQTGDQVTYEIGQSDKGPVAVRVKVIPMDGMEENM